MSAHVSEIQLACFCLGERLFAVDIMRISEILMPQKISGLPRESSILDGVINLRGNVIPVMNMRKRFGMPVKGDDKPGKLLIVTLARQILALVVDDVMEVITVPAGEIKPPPQMVTGVGMEYVLGVCLSNGQVHMILDIDSLLDAGVLPEISRFSATPSSPAAGTA